MKFYELGEVMYDYGGSRDYRIVGLYASREDAELDKAILERMATDPDSEWSSDYHIYENEILEEPQYADDD